MSKQIFSPASRSTSRIAENSLLDKKIIPALLISLGILMVVLILIAGGILLGIIPYS